LIEAGDACARETLERRRAELEAGIQLLLKQETLTAEQFAPLRAILKNEAQEAA
jgi:cell division protease FtsH